VTGETGRSDGAFVGRRNELVSQAQGFQLWEASGEEAEQLLTFGVIEQLVRAAPDSGGPGLADLGNRNGDTRDPIWMGAALVELLGAMQALVFALRRLQATRWSSTEIHTRFGDVPALRSSNHLTTTRIPATMASPWRRSYRQS
jgi:hypothetical protein